MVFARLGGRLTATPVAGQGTSVIVTDPDQCAAIRIQDGLQLFQKTWAFDTTQGMTWNTDVLGKKNPPLVAISNLMRRAILLLGAPVVIDVTQLNLVFQSAKRNLLYAFQAASNSGAVLQGGSAGPDGKPFVLVTP